MWSRVVRAGSGRAASQSGRDVVHVFTDFDQKLFNGNIVSFLHLHQVRMNVKAHNRLENAHVDPVSHAAFKYALMTFISVPLLYFCFYQFHYDHSYYYNQVRPRGRRRCGNRREWSPIVVLYLYICELKDFFSTPSQLLSFFTGAVRVALSEDVVMRLQRSPSLCVCVSFFSLSFCLFFHFFF